VQANQAPVVNAGPDQTVSLSAGAALSGTVFDDGLPSGSRLTAAWSKVSGPDAVSFANATAFTTTAIFSAAGMYTLRLTASDGSLSSTDDVVIVVNAVVSACGAAVSGTVTVTASATDDVGVVGVQLVLDGVNFGPEFTTA